MHSATCAIETQILSKGHWNINKKRVVKKYFKNHNFGFDGAKYIEPLFKLENLNKENKMMVFKIRAMGIALAWFVLKSTVYEMHLSGFKD